MLDLPAYALAAHQLEHERVCFLNSYSTILADGWLGQLSHALDDAKVGVAGATGSWESQAEWVRGKPMYWPYQLAILPRVRQDYPRFPNPHLRTTAFMLDRPLLLEAGFERAADKRDTYLLESGHHSFTRQLLARACAPSWSAATSAPTTSRSGPPAPPTAPGTSGTCSSPITARATGSAPLRGCAGGSRGMRGNHRRAEEACAYLSQPMRVGSRKPHPPHGMIDLCELTSHLAQSVRAPRRVARWLCGQHQSFPPESANSRLSLGAREAVSARQRLGDRRAAPSTTATLRRDRALRRPDGLRGVA